MNDFDQAVLDASFGNDADWREHQRIDIDHDPDCDLRTGNGGGCTCPDEPEDAP